MEKGESLEGRLNTAAIDLGRHHHKYGWIALFKDGHIIRQFEGKEDAHHMGHVFDKEKESPLVEFTFQRRKLAKLGGRQIVVNLINGNITIDGESFLPYNGKDPMPPETKYSIEFWIRGYSTIAFQAVKQVGGPKTKAKYFVGWSAELPNGETVKRFICIDEDENIAIG